MASIDEFIATDRGGIWQHYLREKKGNKAKCKECSVIVKCEGGSTSGLHTHQRTKHNNNLLKRSMEMATNAKCDEKANAHTVKLAGKGPGPAGGPMMKYVLDTKERSMAATISWMTARDGLSFHVFSSSPDLRKALLAMGFSDLPKSTTSIQKMVMDHGVRVRSFVSGEIQQLKKQGHRFSLTFDEWTSNRNRRYMCINVHSNTQFWSLGMIRVHGSMPAEKCVELLQQKLSDFGLNLTEDIVCISTDGASVMTKVGKLIKADQQLCFAHGIQLAVLDVLYNHQASEATQAREEIQSDCSMANAISPDSDDNDDDNADMKHKETFSAVQYDYDYNTRTSLLNCQPNISNWSTK